MTTPADLVEFRQTVFWSLADHLGWQRFSLVGHSMGGTIAMRVALERPQAQEQQAGKIGL